MKYIVYHRYYGCETGCCGHAVAYVPDDYVSDEKDWLYFDERVDEIQNSFQLCAHPDGDDFRKFAEEFLAKQFGKEHIADLDWEHCVIVDDEW